MAVAGTAGRDELAGDVIRAVAAAREVSRDAVRVLRGRTVVRSTTTLHTFDLAVDGRPLAVIAKVVRSGVPRPAAGDRPRLAPPADPADLLRLEYAGLESIHERIVATGDRRFTAVEPIALLPERAALVMTRLPAPSFRRRVLAHHRLSRRSAGGIEEAAGRVGGWLAMFQQGESDGLPSLRRHPGEVVDLLGRFGSWLSARGVRPGDLAAMAARVADALPDPLPVAVGHGDFAPRNVLVDDTGRVAVVDPLRRWLVPPWEDLARFCINVRLLGPELVLPLVAFPPERLGNLARAVQAGWGGPQTELAAPSLVFESLILLDKWSGVLGRSRPGRGIRASVAGRSLRREAARIEGALRRT